MLILAFESSAKAASAALVKDGRLISQYSQCSGLTHSRTLLPMGEDMLKNAELKLSDVDLIAVAHGPGSFTGIRIGVSMVKGLAWAAEKPCVGVSTLEALAWHGISAGGYVCPVMDARRKQVYTAIFTSDGESIKRVCEDEAISLTELAQRLKKYEGESIYLVGDGYEVAREALIAEDVTLCNTPSLLITENAYSIARIAYEKYKSGDYVSDTELVPVYLRMPQAERERLERLNNTKEGDTK